MFTGGATSWKNLYDDAVRECGFYSNTPSYLDSGWEVKIKNSSSEICEIYSEGEHPDMDSLTSVLTRLNSAYPDIHEVYIHVGAEEYICSIDDRFQLYTPDPVSSLAMRIMQAYLRDQWVLAKKRNSLKFGEDEG